MKPLVSWITKNDRPILEFLNQTGLALSPRAIRYNLRTREQVELPYSTLNRRLKILLDHGMVEKEYESAGFYSITEKGQKYLAGELSKDDLEP